MTWVRARRDGSVALAGDYQGQVRAGDGVASMWPMYYRPVWRDGYPLIAGRSGLVPGLGDAPAVDTYIIVQKALAAKGLDANAMAAVTSKVMDKYNAQIKQQAMEKAAVSTGFAVAEIVLAMLPVIGQVGAIILAVVYALVQAALQVTTNYFKNKSDQLIADTQNSLAITAAQYDAKLTAVKDQVIKDETPAATAIALSGVPIQTTTNGQAAPPPPAGTNGLDGWIDDLARDLKRAVTATAIAANPVMKLHHDIFTKINDIAQQIPIPAVQNLAAKLNANEADMYSDIKRAEANVDNFIEVGTGEAQWKRAQQAAAQAKTQALAEFERQYQAAVVNVTSAPFRENLRYALAEWIRTNPDIMNMGAASSQLFSSPSLTTTDPSKALQAVPMAAAGIGAAALLLIIGHKH